MNINTQKFRKQTIVRKYNIYKELISRYDKRLEEVSDELSKYSQELNEFIEDHDSIILDLYNKYTRKFQNQVSGKFYLTMYKFPDVDFVLQNIRFQAKPYFIYVNGVFIENKLSFTCMGSINREFKLDDRFKYECAEVLDLDRYVADPEYASDIRREIDSSITRIQKLLDLLNNIYNVVKEKYNKLQEVYDHVMLDIISKGKSELIIKLYNNLISLQSSNNSIYAWFLLQVAGEIYKDVGLTLGLKIQGDMTDFVKNTRVDFIDQCYFKYAETDSIFEEDSDEDVEEDDEDSDDINWCY